MIPRVIHQIWCGEKPIPDRHRRFMDGLKGLHPEWEYHLWTEKSIPEIGLEYSYLINRFWDVVSVSNYIRLKAVSDLGGIYIDTDCECLKPLDPLLGFDAFAALQDHGRICSAVFGATPHHSWVDELLKKESGSHSKHHPAWIVFTMSESDRKNLTVLPSETFYPWMYDEKPDLSRITENTLLIHHWEGSWGKK